MVWQLCSTRVNEMHGISFEYNLQNSCVLRHMWATGTTHIRFFIPEVMKLSKITLQSGPIDVRFVPILTDRTKQDRLYTHTHTLEVSTFCRECTNVWLIIFQIQLCNVCVQLMVISFSIAQLVSTCCCRITANSAVIHKNVNTALEIAVQWVKNAEHLIDFYFFLFEPGHGNDFFLRSSLAVESSKELFGQICDGWKGKKSTRWSNGEKLICITCVSEPNAHVRRVSVKCWVKLQTVAKFYSADATCLLFDDNMPVRKKGMNVLCTHTRLK